MAELLVHCNGRELTVQRVGPIKVKYCARPHGPPLKPHGWRLVEEAELAPELRALADSDLYDRVV